ncbi:MAG: hypothetical protein ACYS8W_11585 [Planctomycetota bacterium]|jgi:hypothetical protein
MKRTGQFLVLLAAVALVFAAGCSKSHKSSRTDTPTYATGTGGGPPNGGGPWTGGNELYCATGQYASGSVEKDTLVMTDGDVVMNKEINKKYGFAKISLAGVPTTMQVEAVTVNFLINVCDVPEGRVWFANGDAQAGDTNPAYDRGHESTGEPKFSGTGWFAHKSNSSGISYLNEAIASGQGHITVVLYGC